MTDYYTCDQCNGHAAYCGCYEKSVVEDHLTTEPPPTVKRNLTDQTDAMRDVVTERARQISAEGWSPEHDDSHSNGDLAAAAACYAVGEMLHLTCTDGYLWPWGEDAWKPTDRRRELVKAGALILAEIERLDRSERAKPVDPLVEAMQEWWDADGYANIETFLAAIEKRGGKIVWEDGE